MTSTFYRIGNEAVYMLQNLYIKNKKGYFYSRKSHYLYIQYISCMINQSVFIKIICFCFGLLLFACKSKLNELSWNVDAVAPLAKGSVSIKQILQEDSILVENSDNTVRLITEEELYRFENPLDSLVNISIKPFERTSTLSSLVLTTQKATDTTTMEELLDQSGVGIEDGSTLPSAVVSLFGNVDLPPQTVDFSDFMEKAVLKKGILDITIDNHLPLVLKTATLEVRNTSNNLLLFDQQIEDLQPYSIFMETQDLAARLDGDTIEGNLTVIVKDMVVEAHPDSSTITFHYDDYVAFTVAIRDIEVEYALAIFPSQNVIDVVDDVPLLGLDDIELKEAIIDSGIVNVKASSTLPTELYIYFELPGAKKDGKAFSFNAVVPAASDDGIIQYDEDFIFTDYDLDLTGVGGDTVNNFINILTGRIDSTGEKIPLSLSDTLYILLQIERLKPSYVKGYLGQDTIQVGPEKFQLSDELGIMIHDLEIEDLNLDILIENNLGFEGNLNFQNLSTTSEENNVVISSVTNSTHEIDGAMDMGSSVIGSETFIDIVDAKDLINNNPDALEYQLTLYTNPSGNDQSYTDFIYNSESVTANAVIDLPLSFKKANISITDTTDFNLDAQTQNAIKNGKLTLVANNSFPIDFIPQLFFLDEFNQQLGSLTTPSSIEAAPVDGNGKTTEATQTIIEYDIDQSKIDRIMSSKKLMLKANFKILEAPVFTKIYSDYELKFRLFGEFNAEINAGL